jgi:hypothetical protein
MAASMINYRIYMVARYIVDFVDFSPLFGETGNLDVFVNIGHSPERAPPRLVPGRKAAPHKPSATLWLDTREHHRLHREGASRPRQKHLHCDRLLRDHD